MHTEVHAMPQQRQGGARDEFARIESALYAIPPDVDRVTWIKVGLALRSELGDNAETLWHDWSSGSANYRESDARSAWRSCGTSRATTIGTLFYIAQQHGWKPASAPRSPYKLKLPRQAPKPVAPRDWDNNLAAVWNASDEYVGTIVETYLQARGCALPPADGDVRFLPRARYFRYGDDEHQDPHYGHEFPAMLCRVSDASTNFGIGLHFTFLQPDGSGKAEVSEPKLRRGRDLFDAAGVIRLWADADVETRLVVAEGIETALAVAHARPPAWACVNTSYLAKLPALPGVESLLIVADRDPGGERAAQQCAMRWHEAGRIVTIYRSESEGADFNDDLRAEVANG